MTRVTRSAVSAVCLLASTGVWGASSDTLFDQSIKQAPVASATPAVSAAAISSTPTVVSPLVSVPEPITVPPVVVTAARSRQSIAGIPDAVTVVTAKEAAAAGALDLGSAVSRAPGVDVTRFGYAGTMSSISIRGAKSSQVLVMKDGRPVNQPSTGQADASLEFANEMDRVEVLRGPSGLLYGSNALGGVVNILTPEPPSAFSVSAGVLRGGYNTDGSTVRVGGPVGPGRWLVQHTSLGSDGFRENSAYSGNSWMLKGSLFANPRLVITGTANETALGLPGVLPASDTSLRGINQGLFGDDEVSSLVDWQRGWGRAVQTRMEWDAPGDNELSVSHSIEAGRVRNRYGDAAFSPIPTMVTSLIANSVQVVEMQDHVKVDSSWDANVTAGGGWRKEHMDSSEFKVPVAGGQYSDKDLIDARVEVGYAYGELRFRPFKATDSLKGFTVATGARFDDNSRFGGITNPHAGFAWESGAVVVKGSAGTAFRAPSLNDLYWPADAYTSGNPDLDPEHGRTAEMATEVTVGGIKARAGGFWRDIKDQIDWAPDSAGFWKPRNTGSVTTRGIEMEGSASQGWLSMQADLTWLDSVQRRTETTMLDPFTYAPSDNEVRNRRAAFVPRVMAGGMVTANSPWGTSVSLTGKYTGDRRMYLEDSMSQFPSVIYREKRLAPYTLLGLRLAQRVAAPVMVYLGVENLANVAYAEQFGNSMDDGNYPMPGRSIYGGMEAKW